MAEIIIKKEQHECPPAVAAYIKELKAENARLEELYQKSVGVIAATNCVECKNKVYHKAYNDVMMLRANIQEIIEDVSKKDGGAENA